MINAAQTCLSNRTSRPAGMRASRATGFTLIELLVVIGIIALLAALVVGGTKYTGTKMKENRVRTELKALIRPSTPIVPNTIITPPTMLTRLQRGLIRRLIRFTMN